MAKQIKIWNGRAPGNNRGHIYVAAFSKKQAVDIINIAFGSYITDHEINVYYSKGSWGNSMDGITPSEPCVYYQNSYSDTPVKKY